MGNLGYDGRGGHAIGNGPATGLTAAGCKARCDADPQCDCVTFQTADSHTVTDGDAGDCWKRSQCVTGCGDTILVTLRVRTTPLVNTCWCVCAADRCVPAMFEHDAATAAYSVFVKKNGPKPPPTQAGGTS